MENLKSYYGNLKVSESGVYEYESVYGDILIDSGSKVEFPNLKKVQGSLFIMDGSEVVISTMIEFKCSILVTDNSKLTANNLKVITHGCLDVWHNSFVSLPSLLAISECLHVNKSNVKLDQLEVVGLKISIHKNSIVEAPNLKTISVFSKIDSGCSFTSGNAVFKYELQSRGNQFLKNFIIEDGDTSYILCDFLYRIVKKDGNIYKVIDVSDESTLYIAVEGNCYFGRGKNKEEAIKNLSFDKELSRNKKIDLINFDIKKLSHKTNLLLDFINNSSVYRELSDDIKEKIKRQSDVMIDYYNLMSENIMVLSEIE